MEERHDSDNPDRTNISYHLLRTFSSSRTLIHCFGSNRNGLDPNLPKLSRPAIIFYRNRRSVEKSAALLQSAYQNFHVYSYHAGMPKKVKMQIERDFMESGDAILCSTNAYGIPYDLNMLH